ncbi:MAG: cytochrome c nitrite reductase small subunit [Anaerolineales bacterium]|nr:cytochrome c nitrite reductase small subunit [Anaerolineales bacterium]
MQSGNPPRKRKHWRVLVVLGLVAVVAGVFVNFGPPGLYAKSKTAEFCAGCHVMETEYESWSHNGGHRRILCVDCHLPNDNMARHFAWKGIEGMWDAYVYYSGHVPDSIQISKHGAAIVQENCQRCHTETIARINEDRNCWQCHRRLSHKNTGAL